MSHARIEEVSDSDPSEAEISDNDDFDDERDILKARPSQVVAPRPNPSAQKPNPSLINPAHIPSQSHTAADGTRFASTEDAAKYKNFQCIYPVYFDASRSRNEGRMVGKELAVIDPMAREIVNACAQLGLETLFEPTKIHPKDWANPGRVKVKLRDGKNSNVKNKHHLYTLISKHLQTHPTTVATATLVRVPGVPPPDSSKPYPEPAVPKGWKMNKILPYFSPGLTGGGVSDNFFKDMMAEMQNAGGAGAGMPGMPDMSALQGMMGAMGAGGPSTPTVNEKKKEKKKKVIRG